jgi:hypothetical protein
MRLEIDGWGVAQVDLERSWSGQELTDRGYAERVRQRGQMTLGHADVQPSRLPLRAARRLALTAFSPSERPTLAPAKAVE